MHSHKKVMQIHSEYKDSSDCCISPRMKMQLDSLGHGSRLVWTLSKEQILYIQKYYNYTVLPHIYKIKTIRELPTQTLNIQLY